MVSFQVVSGQEIAFYMMNQGNYSLWRTGRPSTVVRYIPMAASGNFTLTPQATGTYYFIFENQDSSRHSVIFSLSVLQTTETLDPYAENAGFLVIGLGLVIFLLGARTGGKKRPKAKAETIKTTGSTPRCKYCGAEITKGQSFCSKCGRSQQ